MNINSAINKVNARIEEILPERSAAMIGGKRARAKLFLAFARGEDPKAIDIAASIELIHAATLIHDDVLDNSTIRRGRPSLFRKIGVSEGILYGDFLFSKAFSVISSYMAPVLNKEISEAVSEILEGEIMEKKAANSLLSGPEEYFSIVRKKTGILFGVAAKLGALHKGDGDEFSRKAYRFGVEAGAAYQVADDLLDYFSDSPEKDRFNDIRGGLATLPLLYLDKRCDPDERSFIGSVFGNKNADINALVSVREMMSRYDVFRDVAAKISEFLRTAENSIGKPDYAEIGSAFDVINWIRGQILHVQSSDSRGGICGS